MTPDLLPTKFSAQLVVDESGCWRWTGPRTRKGYGIGYIPGTPERPVHRITYHLLVGPIPQGMEVDHLCRVTDCCNPSHLEAVTPQENRRRALNAPERRTHCPQGHPYAGANLYTYADGRRACRACLREAGRRYQERQKALRTP